MKETIKIIDINSLFRNNSLSKLLVKKPLKGNLSLKLVILTALIFWTA